MVARIKKVSQVVEQEKTLEERALNMMNLRGANKVFNCGGFWFFNEEEAKKCSSANGKSVLVFNR